LWRGGEVVSGCGIGRAKALRRMSPAPLLSELLAGGLGAHWAVFVQGGVDRVVMAVRTEVIATSFWSLVRSFRQLFFWLINWLCFFWLRSGRGFRLGLRLVRNALLRVDVRVERLETLKFAEGVAITALGGTHHAVEAGEGAVAFAEGLTEWGVFAGFVRGRQLVNPDLGFGDGEAAEGPGGSDEDIDLVALLGGERAVALVILVNEGGEVRGIFAGDDERLGVDAGFQGIHGGAGLAFGGARSRGLILIFGH
jgi:hypothetical protein